MKKILLCAALLAALGVSGSATAAASCKGLTKSKCAASDACSWVSSYERKDGKVVKAFCRKAAGSSKAKSSKAKPKTATKAQTPSKTTSKTTSKASKKQASSKAKQKSSDKTKKSTKKKANSKKSKSSSSK